MPLSGIDTIAVPVSASAGSRRWERSSADFRFQMDTAHAVWADGKLKRF